MVGLVIFILMWVWILWEMYTCPLLDDNEEIIKGKNKRIKN